MTLPKTHRPMPGFTILLLALSLWLIPLSASAQIVEGFDLSKLPPPTREKVRINAGAVSILVSGSTCTCARMAEDIRYVVNDVQNPRQGTVRVVPVLGEGGIQNLKDTLFLRGISMAIVDESTLTALKERNPRAYGNIEKKLRYITKLYNAELHVLARKDIKNINELTGKIVNFDYKDSETDLVASRVFDKLGINPTITHDDQRYALKRLLSGEIAAIVMSSGAPVEILTRIKPEDGLHFIGIDESASPGGNTDALFRDFLPAELKNDHYPNLIETGKSVPTIASRVLLATYNWPSTNVRFLRNVKFVREFFSRINEFRNPARHSKWADVNLLAKVPGWTRLKPAELWLKQNAPKISPANIQITPDRQEADRQALRNTGQGELFNEFERFLNERRKK